MNIKSDSISVMTMRKAPRGYSLAEVMIAMAILAIGMAAVAATLIYGSQKSKHGDSITQAVQHARTLVEVTMGQGFNDNAALVDAGTGLPKTESGLNDTATQDFRALDDPPFSASLFLPDRALGDEGRTGSGHLEKFKRKITMVRRGVPADGLALMTVTVQWEEEGAKRNVSLSAVIPDQP